MVHKRLHLLLILTTSACLCAAGSQELFAQAVKSARSAKPVVPQSVTSEPARGHRGPEYGLPGRQSAPRAGEPAEPLVDAVSIARLDPTPALSSLSGHQVACQAANCFPLARLLQQRAATLECEAEQCGQSGQPGLAQLQAAFLRRQAARQRDVAAATALRAYYAWIANRQQLELVEEGQQFLHQQIQLQAALISQGVAIADPTALDRKRLELIDQQIQLRAADGRLASALLRLTCCASDLRTAAVEGLDILPAAIHGERLRRLAFDHRQDYQALVQLCQCLTASTARGIADMLTPLVGVGLNLPDCKVLQRLVVAIHGDELVQQVRQELTLAIQSLRERIEEEVGDKSAALSTAYQRVAVAQAVLESWEQRLAALGRLEELGDARGQEMNQARSELLTARATLITRKLDAKLAEVDLAEAIGQIALRCSQGEAWLIR